MSKRVLEIERKYLLQAVPAELAACPHARIDQGYLAYDTTNGMEVRLRRYGAEHFLTAKQKLGRHRREHEIAISAAQWEELWPLTAGRRLAKVRYRMAFGPYTVEVDEYLGANTGLLIAEVEFPSEAEAANFTPPAWFGEEVTNRPEYSNRLRAVE